MDEYLTFQDFRCPREGRRLLTVRGLLSCFLTFATVIVVAQEKDTVRASFKFSGTINVNTNGISPIPAFSLEKPAIQGFLSLRKNRFSFDPEIAFSVKGVPWFLNTCFRYKWVEKPKFQFRTGLIWGVGYSHPEIMQDGALQTIAKAERFFWLELLPRYVISEKLALSSLTYIGYNFEPGSVKRIDYFSIIGQVTKVRFSKKIYFNFFPQLFYLNIDGASDGYFVAGVFGIGHSKIPLVLSTQINQTLTTNLSPDPGFKWNVGLSYSF